MSCAIAAILWYAVGFIFMFATLRSFGDFLVRDLLVCLMAGFLGPICLFHFIAYTEVSWFNRKLF